MEKNKLQLLEESLSEALIKIHKEAMLRQKKVIIDKACEWLYVYYPTLERAKSFEDAWKHFKKAMED